MAKMDRQPFQSMDMFTISTSYNGLSNACKGNRMGICLQNDYCSGPVFYYWFIFSSASDVSYDPRFLLAYSHKNLLQCINSPFFNFLIMSMKLSSTLIMGLEGKQDLNKVVLGREVLGWESTHESTSDKSLHIVVNITMKFPQVSLSLRVLQDMFCLVERRYFTLFFIGTFLLMQYL